MSQELFDELSRLPISAPERFDDAGAIGGGDIVTLLVEVTVPNIGIVAKLIVDCVKLNRTKVEIDGMKADNILVAQAEALLRDALEHVMNLSSVVRSVPA